MISILVPTRKRPQRLKEMIDSALLTTFSKDAIEILAYVTYDDSSYDGLIQELEDLYPLLRFYRGPRVVFSALWNKLVPHALGNIFMLCADDVLFRTPDWNVVVENAFDDFPDKILCAYGDDVGPNGKHFATLPFVSRKWVETIGYFTPDGYSADFCDSHVQDVADMIGRKRLLPIVTEHAHWIWGKAEKDETYRENIVRNERDNNAKLYTERLWERKRDAEKLWEVMSRWRLK